MVEAESRRRCLIFPLLALTLSISITVLIIVSVLHPVYLTSWGNISAVTRTIYITGVSILATILTGFIGSQIQSLLARDCDRDLSTWDPQTPITPLSRRWRAILKIDTIKETPRNFLIHLGYIVVGLITAALVTSLTPYPTTRSITYSQKLANGPSVYPGNGLGLCTEIIPRSIVKYSDWPYMWNYGTNGTVYLVQVAEGGCPTRQAQMLLGNINSLDPDIFAYADSGVAAHQSAIGAPLSLYSPQQAWAPDFSNILNMYGYSIIETAQCARVMKRNPIHCVPGGKVGFKKLWFNITSQDGKCSTQRQYTDNQWDRWNGEGSMLKEFCPGNTVGQGTIIFGAHGGYAHWLAQSINDWKRAPPTKNTSTYVITCSVDARDIFEYRNISLVMQNGGISSHSRYSRLVSATGEPCIGPSVDLSFVAIAASANWQILLQNEGLDGWFDLTWQAAGDNRPPPYGFVDSKNALEDVLGLVAAMVTARINSTFSYSVPSSIDVFSMRVGSGKLASLVFLVPPIAASLILGYLILRNLFSPVGEFDTTNLAQLVKFGSLYGERAAVGYATAGGEPAKKGKETASFYQQTLVPRNWYIQRTPQGAWSFSINLEDEGLAN